MNDEVLRELAEIKRLIGAGQRRLLLVNEVAFRLSLSPKTIRNRLSNGEFPIKAVKLAGRTLFKAKDVDALVESL